MNDHLRTVSVRTCSRKQSIMAATLAPPVLPEYMFRYRSIAGVDKDGKPIFDREMEAILAPYIWCAGIDDLNDPMEGLFEPTRRMEKLSSYQKIGQRISFALHSIGIAALSDTNRNELMWAHYAANSSGICIEYRARRFLSGLPDNSTLAKVAYENKPPYIAVADSKKKKEESALRIFSHKKFNWAYEREWRVLSAIGPAAIRGKEVIRRIYMGSRITEAHKFQIQNALLGSHIKLYEMVLENYDYIYKPYVPSKAF